MTDNTRALLEQALEALEAIQSYAKQERKGLRICDETIEAIRAEMARPVEPSYTATQLAAMVLSDCGISTNHTTLHERVAARITRHEDELIDRLKNQAKPPAPAWHDAPTEPGLWFNSINHYADIVSQHWIDRGVVANSHARWYGPIPQDGEGS